MKESCDYIGVKVRVTKRRLFYVNTILIYLYIYIYIYTDHAVLGQFLSRVYQIGIQWFFFFSVRLVACYTKAKELSLPHYLFIDKRRIVKHIPLSKVLAPWEMRIAISRIWIYIYIYIVIHRQICFVLSELISVARQ